MIKSWLKEAREDVSNFQLYSPHLLQCFHKLTLLFTGGQIGNNIHQWKRLTSDKNLLQMVHGSRINFLKKPVNVHPPMNPKFTELENIWIDQEIEKLLQKGIIALSKHEKGEVISPIFLVDKQDGGSD